MTPHKSPHPFLDFIFHELIYMTPHPPPDFFFLATSSGRRRLSCHPKLTLESSLRQARASRRL
ncbi:hypothetical protein T484DRAFT_2191291 [Baffinella frigidus]|nr:hypothetical protein T484DRAFT_2191291 [Cryptophyta sp. CCMP2293]